MWEKLVIGWILTILNATIKNPKKAEGLKGQLLNVRDSINSIYGE